MGNSDNKITKLSREKINALKMWNEFLNIYRNFNNSNPPGLPLWSDYWDIRKNIKIPPVMEFTFYRKDRAEIDLNKKLVFPHPLDNDNLPHLPSLILPECWREISF